MDTDRDTLRDLCISEYPRLVGTLRLACGHDRDLAEDSAQEAIARLCRDWDKVADGPSPRAWLYRVAFNVVNSHWRRVATRTRFQSRIEGRSIVPDTASLASAKVDLERALALLSRRERATIALRFFADMSVNQAAVAMGVSDQAVRSLTHRALTKLRKQLADDPAELETLHEQ